MTKKLLFLYKFSLFLLANILSMKLSTNGNCFFLVLGWGSHQGITAKRRAAECFETSCVAPISHRLGLRKDEKKENENRNKKILPSIFVLFIWPRKASLRYHSASVNIVTLHIINGSLLSYRARCCYNHYELRKIAACSYRSSKLIFENADVSEAGTTSKTQIIS